DDLLGVLFIDGVAGPAVPAGNGGHLDVDLEWRRVFVSKVESKPSAAGLEPHQIGVALPAMMVLFLNSFALLKDGLAAENFIEYERAESVILIPRRLCVTRAKERGAKKSDADFLIFSDQPGYFD